MFGKKEFDMETTQSASEMDIVYENAFGGAGKIFGYARRTLAGKGFIATSPTRP